MRRIDGVPTTRDGPPGGDPGKGTPPRRSGNRKKKLPSNPPGAGAEWAIHEKMFPAERLRAAEAAGRPKLYPGAREGVEGWSAIRAQPRA